VKRAPPASGSPAAAAPNEAARDERADRAGPRASRRIPSAELFGALSEIEIEHNSLVYRLRKTSLGKLILTK